VAEAIWTATVALLLSLWFAASIVYQISPWWWQRVVGSDLFGLLPRWNFFAPTPAREDTHVIYREQCDGQWSAWRALTPATSRRHWRWLWNPQRFTRKAASDLANGLRRSAARFQETPRAILLSNAYVALLHWVMAQPATADVTQRQFAVVTSNGFTSDHQLKVLFVSEPHRVEP
jgi:hypothetical protein